MRSIVLVGLLVLTGCGNQARLDYYAAVQASAEAQARESEARYAALSTMARGDGEASVAAVMAIALAQKPTIQPQFIEDDALKWASILAGPVAAVASLAIQADLSRDLNDSNKDIAIARINADANTDQALYSALTRPQPTPLPSVGADQLDSIVDGLVTLGVAGIDGVGAVGANALDTSTVLSLESMDNLVSVSTTGYQTIEEIVSKSYMTIDSIAEDCGGCGSCFTCTPPDVVIEPPVDPCGDGGLVVSPGICTP
jgi:hypothetical protein